MSSNKNFQVNLFTNRELIKLEELADVIDSLHKTPTYSNNGFPMIRVTDVKSGFLKIDSALKVDKIVFEEFTKKYRPHSGDIIVSRVGTYGSFSYVLNSEKFCLGQNTAIIVPKKINDKYLYYCLSSYLVKNQIDSVVVGSTQKSLSLKNIRELKIPNIESSLQKKIGEILFVIDKKIDINTRQNKVLEQMAQAIFKQWFIDFEFPDENGELYKFSGGAMEMCEELGKEVPKGWKYKSLSEVIDVKHGYAFKGEFFSEEPTDLILLTPGNFKIGGGFAENKFKYYDNEEFPEEYILSKGDLIVSMTDLSRNGDTLGYPAIVPDIKGKKMLHNQRLAKVNLKNDFKYKTYIYLILCSYNYRQNILASATGSTVKHTAPNRILQYKFICPQKEVLKEFELHFSDFQERIELNTNQIRVLTNLRDTLLPKLMSGEIDISNIEI